MKPDVFQRKCRNHTGDGYLCEAFYVDIQRQGYKGCQSQA